MIRPKSFPNILHLLRRGQWKKQRLGLPSDWRRQLVLEDVEPRLLLAGIPELIELNSTGASRPADFTQVGEFVYFTADDGQQGRELWRTDGTASGTTLVQDINPGSAGSDPRDLVEFKGQLVFAADDGAHGEELWISDGTASGTMLLHDIHPGEGYQSPYGYGTLQSFPREMVELDGQLFFSAEDEAGGSELWRTDGTSSGLARVADIAPGTFDDDNGTYPNSSNPQDLTVVDGTLFFTADDGTTGRELWKTDGTESGTVLVKDIFEGDYPYYYDNNYYGVYPNSSSPSRLTASNGLLFFTATDGVSGVELWRSDGTDAGTFLLNDIQPGSRDAFYGDDDSLTDVNGLLFFAAEDDTVGKELWVSDGTEGGTELVRDIRSGTVSSITNGYFTPFDGHLYFAADDGSVGTELWRSDGTEDGTVLVANIDGTNSASFPRYLEEVEGRLFFSAFTSDTGRELWETDGTEAGTVMVDEILPGAGSASPQELFGLDRILLFSADDGSTGRELYAVSAIGDALTAELTVYVDGQEVSLPANIGVDSDGMAISQVRTLGGQGTLDIGPIDDEPLQAVTLGDFFETWRTNAGQPGNNPDATFDDDNLLGNQVDGDNTIHMFVNGQLETEYDDYIIQDGDEIILAYGDNPVVSMNTNFGSLVVELFEEETPGTVENFLNYVNDGDYLNSFFHRSVPGFVIQGGGFVTSATTFTDTSQFTPVPTDDPIENEPGISNLRGTVAMAKLGGQPDSATSQFFVNLSDDNTFLDSEENDAFTVFAQVLDMTVADEIADLPVDMSNDSPFGELPLSSDDELVVIESIEGQGSVTGTKYIDNNTNGVFDTGDSPLAGITVYADQNDNQSFEPTEPFAVTNSDGQYVLSLAAGEHVVRAERTAGQFQTQPTGDEGYEVTVEIGRDVSGLDFGEATVTAPSSVNLLANSDTGTATDDDLTRLNNADSESTLQFQVEGVVAGATVQLFSDGTPIGSVVASTTSAVVTTDGQTSLADGIHSITARQELSGIESEASSALDITIDSTDPATIASTPPDIATFNQLYSFNADSPDEGQVTYALADAPSGMSIDANSGQVEWTPTLSQTGPQEFDIQVIDNAGNIISQRVPLTVLGVIPANPDSYTVNEDQTLNVGAAEGVLANDGNATSGSLTASLVDDVSNGTLTLNDDGSFSYTPEADFFGTDRFTYQATDGTDDTNVATVTLTVVQVNDPVLPQDDTYSTEEDTVLTVSASDGVLANDTDPDDDPLEVNLANQPTNGSLTLNDDGSFEYAPDANFFGTDSFAYTVFDGVNTTDPVSVTITVTAVDDVPSVTADVYTVDEDTTLDVSAQDGVLANDNDPDGDITASVDVPPTRGTVTLNSDGSFSYTPEPDFAGTDSFIYTATDGVNNATTAVTIEVNDVPDPPTATADQFDAVNDEVEVELDVLDNDRFDPDLSDSLSVTDVSEPASGGTVRIENGRVFYAAPAGFTGTDTFNYTITDEDGLTATATVEVDVTDASDNQLSGSVYLDSNGDGQRNAEESGVPGVLITLLGTTTIGESINRTALTDDGGFYAFDNLPAGTYQVIENQPSALSDGGESSDAPDSIITDDQISNIVLSGGTEFTANDFAEARIGSAYLSIAWFFASSTSSSKLFRDTIANGEELNGKHELAESIRNGGSPPPDDIDNRSPVAVSDSYSTPEGETLSVPASQGVLNNDVDPDGDTLTATIVETSVNGDLTLDSNGAFTYTPDAGFTGSDSFRYSVSDGSATSNTAMVTLTVTDEANTFSLQENSPTGTLVGRVDIPSDSGELSYAFADPDLPPELRLRPDDHVDGDPAAPLVLIEYLDLQCPNCQRMHPIIEDLKDDFEGDLLVVSRHFPLTSVHPNATVAALNAEAAGRQNAFDEMVDLMFQRQEDWAGLTNAEAQDVFNDYADELGLDLTQFAEDVADPAVAARVARDDDAAASLGLSGTPSLFLNGEAVDLSDAFDDFESIVEGAIQEFDEPFVINRSTGDILVADGNQLDFETNDSFSLTATGTNTAGETTSVDVTINLLNANEAAPEAAADTYSVNEDSTLTVTVDDGLLQNDTDDDQDSLTAVPLQPPAHGTLTLSDDGSFRYEPEADFSGTDSFTYQANDGSLDSNVATVTLNVSPVNDAPVATEDVYFVTGESLTIDANAGVLSNDTDVDNDAADLMATVVDTTSNGTLSLNSDGSFVYTPDPDFTGDDTFTYQVDDGSFSSSVVTVTLTVTGANNAPAAINDGYMMNENETLTVSPAEGVLQNDQDDESDALTANLVTGPTNGTLSFSSDGGFTYTPDADFTGSDSFTYRAADAGATSNSATVTITVNSVNELPQAVDDTYSVTQGNTLEVPIASGVLANDVDPDGDTLSAVVVDDVSNGQLALSSNGGIIYTPTDNFIGTDSFTYVASDGSGDSNTATVEIVVNAINTFSLLESADADTLVGQLQITDAELNGNVIFETVQPTVPAELRLAADDHFLGSAKGTVTLIEYLDFACPACAALHPVVEQLETEFGDELVTVRRHLPLDSHPNALPAAIAAEAAGRQGLFNDMADALFDNQSEWANVDDPQSLFENYLTSLGGDLEQFRNDQQDPALADRVQRDVQTANALNATGTPTFFLEGQLLSDVPTTQEEFAALIQSEVEAVDSQFYLDRQSGQLFVRDSATFDFNAEPTLTVDVRITDEEGDSEVITATINLVRVNDQSPVAEVDAYDATEDTELMVPAAQGVLANDTDPDGNSLVARLEAGANHGTVQLQLDGSLSYMPDANFVGTDSFQYIASDGRFDSAAVTVTITVAGENDVPVANDDSFSVDENTSQQSSQLELDAENGVLANDTDADGDMLSATLIDSPTNGALVLNSDGSLTYTPAASFSGSDSFTYEVTDGAATSNVATVNIQVNDVNQIPEARDDNYVVQADNVLAVVAENGLLANDRDDDGDMITALVDSLPANGDLLLAADGTFQYTPDAGFSGTDSFDYFVNDGLADSPPATVTIQVNPPNSFTVDESARTGSLVGQLVPQSDEIDSPALFEVVDNDRPNQLRLVPDDHLSGDTAAPVVLVEYLDFQCPTCAAFHPVVQQLKQSFAGDLLVVSRHLALTSIHDRAFVAAIASEAAARQGEFDAMADLLFTNQAEWSGLSEAEAIAVFEGYATSLGLDLAEFQADMDDPDLAERVQRDADAAIELGAAGTPTFYLQGEPLSQLPQTASEFNSLVQAAVDAVDDVFAIDRLTGEVRVADGNQLDFESMPQHTLDVRVTDLDGTTETITMVVNLNDLDDTGGGAVLSAPLVDSVFEGV